MKNVESKPSTSSDEGNGRNKLTGQFTAGNKLAKGNPFARKVAQLRRTMLDTVTEEDVQAIIISMIAKAIDGDVAAAKLVFSYTVGRPGKTEQLDDVRLKLWERLEERMNAEA